MSHNKKDCSQRSPKCSLKTLWGCANSYGKELVSSSDGQCLAFISVSNYRRNQTAIGQNGERYEVPKVAFVEVAAISFLDSLKLQLAVKMVQKGMEDDPTCVALCVDLGSFLCALVSSLEEAGCDRVEWTLTDVSVIEAFLARQLLFPTKHTSPFPIDWEEGQFCLERTVNAWRNGPTY